MINDLYNQHTINSRQEELDLNSICNQKYFDDYEKTNLQKELQIIFNGIEELKEYNKFTRTTIVQNVARLAVLYKRNKVILENKEIVIEGMIREFNKTLNSKDEKIKQLSKNINYLIGGD